MWKAWSFVIGLILGGTLWFTGNQSNDLIALVVVLLSVPLFFGQQWNWSSLPYTPSIYSDVWMSFASCNGGPVLSSFYARITPRGPMLAEKEDKPWPKR